MLLFNRPGLTRRNLAAIRRAAPEQLFVVADGPREGRPDDVELCAQVREVIGEVDWPCQVNTRFAEKNLGLDPNIETGLDWVLRSRSGRSPAIPTRFPSICSAT
jgi:hypothetical protein